MNSEFDIVENTSKKRKTYHYGDNIIVKNPLKVFDLNEVKDLESELDSKSCQVDFVMNSHKKRNFRHIDSENKFFISQIPKPMRSVNVYYSKYAEHPSNIPKNN